MLAGLNAGGADAPCVCAATVCDSIALTPSVKSCIFVIKSTMRMLALVSRPYIMSDIRFRRSSAWRSLSRISADIPDMRVSATFSRCLIGSFRKAMDASSLGFGAPRLVSPRAFFILVHVSHYDLSSHSLLAICRANRDCTFVSWAKQFLKSSVIACDSILALVSYPSSPLAGGRH